MQGNKLKNYITLHLVVFVWGFTAILGVLISLDAMPLVFFRMWLAVFFIALYFLWKKKSFKISKKQFLYFGIGGVILGFHWITFYKAIKVSNVSITMVTLSTGTFFVSLLEPIFFKRKIKTIEVVLGLFVVGGLYLVNFQEGNSLTPFLSGKYTWGIFYALISAFLSALISVINGKLVENNDPEQISFYQLFLGVSVITIVIAFTEGFSVDFFKLSLSNWFYLILLSSICTAWAVIEATKVMQYITPYTVMLTINLEPIYAIVLALILFKEQEKMNSQFYFGAFIILFVVVLNGLIKSSKNIKKLIRK